MEIFLKILMIIGISFGIVVALFLMGVIIWGGLILGDDIYNAITEYKNRK